MPDQPAALTEKGVALFDFDGTLTRGDSIAPYVLSAVRTGFAPPGALFRAVTAFIGYAFHHIGASAAKERALSFLRGKTKVEADAFADYFYEKSLKKRLYPAAVSEMQRCREAGLTLILVTASPDVYMRTAGAKLNMDGVIATRLSLGEDGFYTGKLASPNCAGPEKARRIADYLAERRIRHLPDKSRSYGNSTGDIPMLLLTGSPFLVNGNKASRKAVPDMPRLKWKRGFIV